jgi:hypothetical protein
MAVEKLASGTWEKNGAEKFREKFRGLGNNESQN